MVACPSAEPSLPPPAVIHTSDRRGSESPPLGLIFACSLCVLGFEIAILRILSIRFSYHYASVAVAISMLGLVVGGLVAALRPRTVARRSLGFRAAFLGLSFPSVICLFAALPIDQQRMLWERAQPLYFALLLLALAVPFLVYGLFLSRSLSSFLAKVPRVYAADLAGAASGLILGLMLIGRAKPEWTVVVCGLVSVASGLWYARSRGLLICLAGSLLLSALLLRGPLGVEPSAYKGLSQALREEATRRIATVYSGNSRLDAFENPRMKFAPGLSLAYTKPVPGGVGLALDGEVKGVVLDDRRLSTFDFLTYLPGALPYMLADLRDVLIIGGAGQLDVLMPHYFGVQHVRTAERDRSVVRFLEDRFPATSHYRAGLYAGYGRALLKRLDEPQDLISLSLTGFYPSGTFGLQEEYDLTVEAVRAYLEALKPGGFLFIQMFILPPPRYELRTVLTLFQAFAPPGVGAPGTQLLVYRSWDTINFLARKGGFTGDDRRAIARFLDGRQYQVLFPPPEGGETFITGSGIGRLINAVADPATRAAFIKVYPFDVRPATDDRPFFHYFLKLGGLAEVYRLVGGKWAYFLHEGMALPFVTAFLILLSALLVGLASGLSRSRPSAAAAGYFLSIGFGFMFIEIFFIHRFILPYGDAVTAFAAVVGTLLVSAGVGSLLSERIARRRRRSGWVLMALPALVLAYGFGAERVVSSVTGVVFLVPAGVLLGLFFPLGLERFSKGEPARVPVLYVINGSASIIAPPVASIVAVQHGCSSLLFVAAALYTVALFLLHFARHGHKGHRP